jgi:hypothetical protein
MKGSIIFIAFVSDPVMEKLQSAQNSLQGCKEASLVRFFSPLKNNCFVIIKMPLLSFFIDAK